MPGKLICLGEALIDFFSEDGFSYSANPGGAPANVAVANAKLGGSSLLLTQVGKDPFGSLLLSSLRKYGVDVSYIAQTAKAKTALAFVSVSPDGENQYSFYRNPSADMLYQPDLIPEEIFTASSILHFCSVDLIPSPMKEAHKKAIELAASQKMIISFDPNLRYNLWEKREDLLETVRSFIPLADIIKVNEAELQALTGESAEEKGARALFQGRVKLVIVTRGSQGASAYARDGSRLFSPAFKPAHVVDTTGAGDTFIGAFLNRLLLDGRGLNALLQDKEKLAACLSFANRASSFCVQAKSAMPSMPYLKDLL
jgi:fructokinase